MAHHRIPFIALALLLLVGCAGSSTPVSAEDRQAIQLCASFSTMADFSKKIAGDRAQVTTLVPAGAEPHDWEPTARDIGLLEQADLLVLNGAGFEHWADSVAPTLKNTDLLVVDTSLAIDLLEGEEDHHHEDEQEDEDDGHGHSHDADPHVWLDPVNAGIQMQAIRDALVELDPDGASVYDRNLEEQLALLDELNQEYANTLAGLPGREIVVAHRSFGYLCARYGLEQVAAQGLSPEGEPDPARMAQVIDYAAEHEVTVIFFERLASPKVAEAIAREIGAETAVLDPLEELDLEGGEDYYSIMRENLTQLALALA